MGPYTFFKALWARAPILKVVYNSVILGFKDSELGAKLGDHRIYFGQYYDGPMFLV